MKILIDGRLLSESPTGIDRYTRQCIRIGITRYGREQVHVLTHRSFPEIDCRQIQTRFRPFHLLHVWIFSFARIWDRYDVVFVPFYVHRFRRSKTKSILVIHDLMFELVPGFFSENRLVNTAARWYYRLLVKQSCKHASHILSVSSTTQQDVVRYGFQSRVFAEGINLIEAPNSTIRPAFQSPETFYMYVGNTRPHKHVSFLLDAVRAGIIQEPVWIITRSVIREPIPSGVFVWNDVSDVELIHLYKHTKAVIIPSKYEGFGLPVLEALYHRAPVICSRAGALAEFPEAFVLFYEPNSLDSFQEALHRLHSFSLPEESLQSFLKKHHWEQCLGSMMEEMIG